VKSGIPKSLQEKIGRLTTPGSMVTVLISCKILFPGLMLLCVLMEKDKPLKFCKIKSFLYSFRIRKRTQPTRYGDWVQGTPFTETHNEGQSNEDTSEMAFCCDKGTEQEKGKLPERSLTEENLVRKINKEMQQISEHLPAPEAEKALCTKKEAKHVPLREQLVKTWGGKSYYERLAILSNTEECESQIASEGSIDNVTDALLRLGLTGKSRRRSVADVLSAVCPEDPNSADTDQHENAAESSKESLAATIPSAAVEKGAKKGKARHGLAGSTGRHAGRTASARSQGAVVSNPRAPRQRTNKPASSGETVSGISAAEPIPESAPQETLRSVHGSEITACENGGRCESLDTSSATQTQERDACHANTKLKGESGGPDDSVLNENMKLRQLLCEREAELSSLRDARNGLMHALAQERSRHNALKQAVKLWQDGAIAGLHSSVASLHDQIDSLHSSIRKATEESD